MSEKIHMKLGKLEKVFFIVIVLTLSIISNYILMPLFIRTPLHSLQEAINACPYLPTEYQVDVFDCSNMANMLDDWLEQKYGYETFIIIFQPSDGVGSGHAMVMANGILIEPTTKMLIVQTTFKNEIYSKLSSIGVIIIDDVERLTVYYSETEFGYPKRW